MDKLLHFAFSAIIVFTFDLILKDLFTAVEIAVFAGIFKELIDQYVLKTGWDIKDILADLIGIAYASIILIIA